MLVILPAILWNCQEFGWLWLFSSFKMVFQQFFDKSGPFMFDISKFFEVFAINRFFTPIDGKHCSAAVPIVSRYLPHFLSLQRKRCIFLNCGTNFFGQELWHLYLFGILDFIRETKLFQIIKCSDRGVFWDLRMALTWHCLEFPSQSYFLKWCSYHLLLIHWKNPMYFGSIR